jgi:4-amino-4-deoxy-L-arabinose transferase-like glycosyltransferase
MIRPMQPDPRSSLTVRWRLALLLPLLVWLAAFALLYARPAATLERGQGLYKWEGAEQSYRWTGSRVRLPIFGGSGPTIIGLRLNTALWEGRAPPQVRLATPEQSLATFSVIAERRHYRLLLPASTSALLLHSPVERPPPGADELRWLGVMLHEVYATPSGLPLRAAGLALLPALASLPLLLALRWLLHRGYGPLAAVTLLAFALRVVLLAQVPPALEQDELVSLVDAWYLLHTGHDHRGNLLPIGAFEAFGDWISPLITYLELPLVALLGPLNPYAGRLVTALAGTLAVPAAYALAEALRLPRAAALGMALVVALSPWQISLTRVAIQTALLPLSLTLCIWAAVHLVQNGTRRAALWLALAAGIGLYAYPTLELLVPLLVGGTVLLTLWQHGWRRVRDWLPAAALLGVLWLPFAWQTLANPASHGRLQRIMLQADTPGAWLAKWWEGYSSYFSPAFYYLVGDAGFGRFPEGRGVQLGVEALVLLPGVLALLLACLGRGGRLPFSRAVAWLLAGLVLAAPLAASLTVRNPHVYRGSAVAPVYALLVGLGIALLWSLLLQWPRLRAGLAALWLAVLLLQGGQAHAHYLIRYPPTVAERYQDGLLQAMHAADAYADRYDEVRVDWENLHQPYIYLLAVQPQPSRALSEQLVAHPGYYNRVGKVGPFVFDTYDFPDRLPTLEAFPDRFGNPAFLVQEWNDDGTRALLVRQGNRRGEIEGAIWAPASAHR